jgi:hypothetical protein
MVRDYSSRWWAMFSKKHRLDLVSVLWLASILAFALSVIGVLATDGGCRIASIFVLGCMFLLWVWHLCIEIPAEIFKDVKEKSEGLLKLRDIQKENPQDRLEILVKKITLFHSEKESVSYADVEFHILNGNVFDLERSFELKETELRINYVDHITLSNKPTLENKGADKLGACSLSDVIAIRQVLSGDIVNELFKPNQARYVEWTFNLILSVGFDGKTKDCKFTPLWCGVHDTITEIQGR